MNRRNFLLLLGTTALVGCEQFKNISDASAAVKKAAEDVSLIGSGLAPVVAELTGLVDAGTMAKVGSALDVVVKGANELAALPAAPAGQSTVQKIVGAANSILTVASPLLAGTGYGTALLAVQALLPVIQSAVGLMVTQAGPAGMSPDQARQYLRVAAARRR